ncbi:hypothetical protein AVEN_154232-1 [Araneus ventricosus]|uniref:Uncharacterized protein n=1 Tax=Araneus ventricosus TaxID=182803 RepID=A0A4Y2M0Y0_ARAVE|nr:hypothetical protein AVEN_154232-1 [Araneus ventricosus]
MSPIVNQTRAKSPSEAIFRKPGANVANCEPNASQVAKRMVARNLAEFYIIWRFFACARLTEKYREKYLQRYYLHFRQEGFRVVTYLSYISTYTSLKGLVTAIAYRHRANREETPVDAFAHIYCMSVLLDFKKSSHEDSNITLGFLTESLHLRIT